MLDGLCSALFLDLSVSNTPIASFPISQVSNILIAIVTLVQTCDHSVLAPKCVSRRFIRSSLRYLHVRDLHRPSAQKPK
jgi:hypothetical protein